MKETNGSNHLYITRISHLLKEIPNTVRTGKRRMERLFSTPGPDYLPLLFGVPVPEKKDFPEFDRRELFYDIDKMACEQFWYALSLARSGSDAQPVIRPQTGTGTAASIFGLEQDILPDALPWLQQHLTKQQIIDFKLPDDVSQLGLMPHIKKIIEFYQEHLPQLPIYVADTQGPFDLAHLVYGDAIFTEIYDDPAFMKHLMELVTNAYIKITEYLKKLTGEPLNSGYHNPFYMVAGGVRVCEDTTTLLSPDLIDEYVIPYTNRVLDHFGGGFIHYCGRNDHLLNAVLTRVPGCKYINLGNPDKHDMSDVLRRVKNAGKVYYGAPERPKGQSLEDFFRSTLSALDGDRRGLILSASFDSQEVKNPQTLIDLYHRLQDELLTKAWNSVT